MKICYVAHLPNLTGASRSLLDMLAVLNRDEVEPVVLLGKHGPIEDELNKLNIRYKIITYSTSIKEKNKPHINFLKKVKIALAIPKVQKFFKEEKFDLIHNNSLLVRVGMEASYKANIPYICHIRECVGEGYEKKLISENKQFELLQKSSTVIAISNLVRNRFSKFTGNVPIVTVKDGIDIDKYLIIDKGIFDKEEVNLLLAGRIESGKGQLEAIEAIEELTRRGITNIKLTIVGNIGDKAYYNKIKDYVNKKGISNIEFASFVKDMRSLQKRADIGLICSKAEALGRATVESMLSKCITIGAKAENAATSEIISDGINGLLYECGNYNDLADKILYAMKNVEKMREIAENGQKYAIENFDNTIYNEKIMEVYNSIIK